MEKVLTYVSDDGSKYPVPESVQTAFETDAQNQGIGIEQAQPFITPDGEKYNVPASKLQAFMENSQKQGIQVEPVHRVKIGTSIYPVPESKSEQFLKSYHNNPDFSDDRSITTRRILERLDKAQERLDEAQRVAQFGEAARNMKAEGFWRSLSREAITNFIPSTSAAVGATAGGVTGFAGAGPVAGVVSGTMGGVGGYNIGGRINRWVARNLFDPETVRMYQVQEEINKGGIAGGLGSTAGNIIGNIPAVMSGKLVTSATSVAKNLSPKMTAMAQNAISGAILQGGQEAEKENANLGDVATEAVKGGLTFASTAIVPLAQNVWVKTLVRPWGEASTVAGAQALSDAVSNHIKTGQPINIKNLQEDLSQKTGENIPLFLLMNMVGAVMEGKPFSTVHLGDNTKISAPGSVQDLRQRKETTTTPEIGEENAIQEGETKQGKPSGEIPRPVGEEIHNQAGETVLRPSRAVPERETVEGEEPVSVPEADLHQIGEPGLTVEEQAAKDAAIGRHEGSLNDVVKILGPASSRPDGTIAWRENQAKMRLQHHDDIGNGIDEKSRGFMAELKNGELAFIDRKQGMEVARRTGQLNESNAKGDELHSEWLKNESQAAAENRMTIGKYLYNTGQSEQDSMLGRLNNGHRGSLMRPPKKLTAEWEPFKALPKELLDKIMVERSDKTGQTLDDVSRETGKSPQEIADQLSKEWDQYQDWRSKNGPSQARMEAERIMDERNRAAYEAANDFSKTMPEVEEKYRPEVSDITHEGLAKDVKFISAISDLETQLPEKAEVSKEQVLNDAIECNRMPNFYEDLEKRAENIGYRYTLTEKVAVGIRMKELENGYIKASKELDNIQSEKGDDRQAKGTAAAIYDEWLHWASAMKNDQSQWGREGRMAQLFSYKVFSLENMTREAARKLGVSIHDMTIDAREIVRKNYEKMKTENDARDAKIKFEEEKQRNDDFHATHEDIISQIKSDEGRAKFVSPTVPIENQPADVVQKRWNEIAAPVKAKFEAWAKTLDERAEAARKSLAERSKRMMSRAGAGVDPVEAAGVVKDLTEMAMPHVLRGTMKAADFVGSVGAELADYARQAWAAAEAQLKAYRADLKAAAESMGLRENKGMPSNKVPPADRRELLLAKGKELASEYGWNKSAYRIAQAIGRTFIEEHYNSLDEKGKISFSAKSIDRNNLIGKIQKEMAKIDPSFDLQRTKDAFSGYGDFKPLSKNVLDVAIGQTKQALLILSKISHLENGEGLLKSGVQRREMSAEDRTNLQKVNALLKANPDLGGRNAEERIKLYNEKRAKSLQNQIDAYSRAVETKKRIVRSSDVAKPEDPPHIKSLIELRDQAHAIYDKSFNEKRTLTSDERRNLNAIENAVNKIVENQIRLATKNFAKTPQDSSKPYSPEAEDLRKQARETSRTVTTEARILELENQIKDVHNGKQPEPKNKTESPKNERVLALEKERADAVREQRILGQIADVKNAIKTGKPLETPAQAARKDSAKIGALKKELADLLKEHEALFYPKPEKPILTPEQRRNLVAFRNAENREKEYRRRIEEGDFTTKPKQSFRYSKEVEQARIKANKAKWDWDTALRKMELANRSKAEKVIDMAVEVRRASILSSLTVPRTLGFAALTRGIQMRTESLEGAAYGALPGFRNVIGQAEMDKSFSAPKEVLALVKGWTLGVHDGWQRLIHGYSNLDLLAGEIGKNTQEYLSDIPVLRYIGNMHFALKSVVFRDAYERFLEYNIPKSMKSGDFESEKAVLRNKAYGYALRQILQNNNAAVKWYQRSIKHLDEKAHERGNIAGKAAVAVVRAEIPIVKVPINMVAEVAEHVGGLFMVGFNQDFRKAMMDASYKLTPEQANVVSRQLIKGTTGAALMCLGFFSYKQIGGLYMPGDKKKLGSLQYGEYNIGGEDYQGDHFHSALVRAVDYAATVHHMMDVELEGKKLNMPEAALVSLIGLIDEIPQFSYVSGISRISEVGGIKSWENREAQSYLQIGALASAAKIGDIKPGSRNAANMWMGEPRQVQLKTWKDYFFGGIWGLREQLQTKRVSQ